MSSYVPQVPLDRINYKKFDEKTRFAYHTEFLPEIFNLAFFFNEHKPSHIKYLGYDNFCVTKLSENQVVELIDRYVQENCFRVEREGTYFIYTFSSEILVRYDGFSCLNEKKKRKKNPPLPLPSDTDKKKNITVRELLDLPGCSVTELERHLNIQEFCIEKEKSRDITFVDFSREMNAFLNKKKSEGSYNSWSLLGWHESPSHYFVHIQFVP